MQQWHVPLDTTGALQMSKKGTEVSVRTTNLSANTY